MNYSIHRNTLPPVHSQPHMQQDGSAPLQSSHAKKSEGAGKATDPVIGAGKRISVGNGQEAQRAKDAREPIRGILSALSHALKALFSALRSWFTSAQPENPHRTIPPAPAPAPAPTPTPTPVPVPDPVPTQTTDSAQTTPAASKAHDDARQQLLRGIQDPNRTPLKSVETPEKSISSVTTPQNIAKANLLKAIQDADRAQLREVDHSKGNAPPDPLTPLQIELAKIREATSSESDDDIDDDSDSNDSHASFKGSPTPKAPPAPQENQPLNKATIPTDLFQAIKAAPPLKKLEKTDTNQNRTEERPGGLNLDERMMDRLNKHVAAQEDSGSESGSESDSDDW